MGGILGMETRDRFVTCSQVEDTGHLSVARLLVTWCVTDIR